MPRVPEVQPYQWPDVGRIEGNALANTMNAQKLADYPEEMAMKRQQQQSLIDQHTMTMENLASQIKHRAWVEQQTKPGQKTTIPFTNPFDGEEYEIEGTPEGIGGFTDAVYKYPRDAAVDLMGGKGQLVSWGAKTHGVSFKKAKAEGVEKTPNEIELIRRAREGDKDAAADLAKLQALRLERSTTNINLGMVDEEGNPLVMKSKGPPKATAAETPPGGAKPRQRYLSPERLDELAGMKTTYEGLEDVKKHLDTLGDKVGPIQGRFEKLKVRWLADGPTQELINELEQMITIVYALSGKQVSYNEIQLIRNAILPRMEQPKENLLATIAMAQKWLKRSHDNRLDVYKKSGFITEVTPIEQTGGAKGPTREQAIAELQKRGKVVNEQTIAAAIKKLGGQ